MKNYDELRERICNELDEVTHDISRSNALSDKDIERIHKLTDIIKNIDKIHRLKDGSYSYGQGDWDAHGNYSSRMSGHHEEYDGSYANRGKHYVRGHYSRDKAKDHMIDQLEEMMEQADNHKVREALERCMTAVENV